MGYTKYPEKWLKGTSGAKSDDERSFSKAVLDKLPEPTDGEYTDNNNYGGDDITLSATNFATSDGSYAKLSEGVKKRSFVNVTLKRKFLNKRWAVSVCRSR